MMDGLCKESVKRHFTPKRVATKRMIPVIQANVVLTNATAAILMISGEISVSSNERAEGREVTDTWKIFSDSDASLPPWATTPTICPAKQQPVLFSKAFYKEKW